MGEEPKQNIIRAVSDYGKRLFYFIRGKVNSDEDAEDVLQDVWFQLANVINAKPVEQLSGWLFRVAKNRIIDKYRSKAGKEELIIDENEERFNFNALFSDDETPEAEDLREFFWTELYAALNELPEEQKNVFVWNELDEISFNEIAERTGEKINTLISRKRYAVLHLRKRLEPLYKEITES